MSRPLNHYCTYFDSGYLAQGVALWQSLRRHDANAILWVLALDKTAERALRNFGDEALRVITLDQLLQSDPELRARQHRPREQFIFTLTPCWVRHVLTARSEIHRLVYLDSDLYFFSSAAPIWSELQKGSVLITPHWYPKWHEDAPRYGTFNVGVVGFRRDEDAQACLEWWRQRCLESTELAADGTRFGDQKYLDEWPRRFEGVVVCDHRGINVAPWNWAGFVFEVSSRAPVGVEGVPLVVFHFAQFRRIAGRWFDSGQLEYGVMPRRLRSRLYGEYWSALLEAEMMIRKVWPQFAIKSRGWLAVLKPWHLGLLRWVWGEFWWRGQNNWYAGRAGLGRFSGRVISLWRRWERCHE